MRLGLACLAAAVALLLAPAAAAADDASAANPRPAGCVAAPTHGRAPACGCCNCCPVAAPAPPPADTKLPEAVAEISKLAIDAAKTEAETARQYYESLADHMKLLLGFFGVIAAIAAFFGYRGMNDIRARYESELATQVGFAKARSDEFEKRLNSLHQLAADRLDALFKLQQIDQLPASEKSRGFNALDPMLQKIEKSAAAAGDLRTQSWALSARARALGELGRFGGGDPARYSEAADLERQALRIAEAMRTADPAALPTAVLGDKHYNLACYVARQGDAKGALEALERGLRLTPENAVAARQDQKPASAGEPAGDFHTLFGSQVESADRREFERIVATAEAASRVR